MALAAHQAPPAASRSPTPPQGVTLFAAPGYSVQARAGDLRSTKGMAVALIHSPYALVKLEDGRFLAARGVRTADDGSIDIGLSHTGSSADAECWVEGIAGGTLSSLMIETVTHIWLGFSTGQLRHLAARARRWSRAAARWAWGSARSR